jgi:hypothetical protein
MNDQGESAPGADTSMNTEKQNVTASRDRARAESADRKAQRRPASSGEFNPGGGEYSATLPEGPAGTDSTVSHASGTHHDRTHIEG